MITLAQSEILQALGFAIGHSLWQMALLWLVYYAATQTFRCTSHHRYALSASASLAGLAMFISTFVFFLTQPAVLHAPDRASGLVSISQLNSIPEGLRFVYHSVLATLRSMAPYLSCAYLVVMFILSLRLANGFREVKQLRTTGLSKPRVDWKIFVQDHAPLLGITRKVEVFVSELAPGPLTLGFWKPLILIPLASINQLSPHQMEAVLLHELSHIRRHDYFINIWLQVAEIVMFFNPFMRVLLRQMRQERENSCDDWVLQFRYSAKEYASALLVLEQTSARSLLALGSNNTHKYQLLNRIRRMVAPERRAFNYRQQLGLLFLITMLGLAFTVIVPKPNPVQNQRATPTRPALNAATTALPAPANPPARGPFLVDLVQTITRAQAAAPALEETMPALTKKALTEENTAINFLNEKTGEKSKYTMASGWDEEKWNEYVQQMANTTASNVNEQALPDELFNPQARALAPAINQALTAMTLKAKDQAALMRNKYRRFEEETRVFERLAKKVEQDQAAMQAQMDKEMHALQQLQEIATQKNNSIVLSDELPVIEVDFDRSQLIVIAGRMLQEKLVRYLAQPSARAYNYSYNVPEEPAAIAPEAPAGSNPAIESRKAQRVTVHANPTDCSCPDAPEIRTTRRPASLRETATLGSTMSAVELEKMATIIGGQWETLVEKEIEVLEQQIREKAKQTHVVDPRVKLTVTGRARATKPAVVQL